MAGWYMERGPEADAVLSSRIRLARNLKDYPFPPRMSAQQAEDVVLRVRDAFMTANSTAKGNFVFVDMKKVGPVEKQVLVEKHLLSPNFIQHQGPNGVVISNDEKISVMINEEDHLRIQCIFSGMQLKEAWELCGKVDSLLEEKLELAFNPDFGYLTCCPTNVGTGIRASVMLHLPALVMTGYIGRVLEACGKLGVAVRGLYGENTEASGNIFQVSNQVTLGQTEEEIISGIENVAAQIIEQERGLRSELYKQSAARFEDRIYRSYGTMKNARIMSTEECMKLLSDVRLGSDMGIIKDVKPEIINRLMLQVQPAGLQKAAGKVLDPEERDIFRADFIREMFKI